MLKDACGKTIHSFVLVLKLRVFLLIFWLIQAFFMNKNQSWCPQSFGNCYCHYRLCKKSYI